MLAALTEFNRFSQAAESNQYIPCSITLEETGGVPSTTTYAGVKDPGIILGVGRGGCNLSCGPMAVEVLCCHLQK